MKTKTKIKFLSALLLGLTVLLSACNKDGCTDESATNYDANAENDDGSCVYDAGGDNLVDYLNPSLTYGEVMDIEGNKYATIQIGSQRWMAENLRTSKFCNGETITNITESNQWDDLTTEAWVHYNNQSENEIPYGKLYNWYAVSDPRNICPCGWHVPSDEDWSILTDYLGGESVSGGKMKATGTKYWAEPNKDATNESGFSGLPGGNRSFDGVFLGMGLAGGWWSSTPGEIAGSAAFRSLDHDHGNVHKTFLAKYRGFSVRCIQD